MVYVEFQGHGTKKMLHELKQEEEFIFNPFNKDPIKYKVVEIIDDKFDNKYKCKSKCSKFSIVVPDRYVWTEFKMSSTTI